MTIQPEVFFQCDIRVGRITQVDAFPKAKKPAYKLLIDFGPEVGVKRSSAQLTELYASDDLRGRLVLAVVNFPPRQVADFMSEVLTLGIATPEGVVLLGVDKGVPIGSKVS